jgi:hypothetical protein
MSDAEQQDSGQVSEVANLDPSEADTPISDADQVAAYPESESGEPDIGEETGPDAHTGSDHTDFPDERKLGGLPPSD